MDISKSIEFQMGDNIVELHMSPVLIENIKTAFGLSLDQEVTEKHVKHYLANGLLNALEVSDENNRSTS